MDQLTYEYLKKSPSTAKDITTSVVYLHLQEGLHREMKVYRCGIVCVLSGKLTLSYDRFIAEPLDNRQLFLLAPGTRCSITAVENTRILLFQTEDIVAINDVLHIEELPVKDLMAEYGMPTIEIKEPIRIFIENLLYFIDRKNVMAEYFELKIRELYHLIRSYYTTEEITTFFYPLYSKNASFAMFILKNYRYVKTVTEFAKLYNCSLSSFDKNFRRAFGISSYKWMMQKRIDLIYHELCSTQKPLKQVAEDTGFSSQPQFTDFCKKHLGASPGQIRKNKTSMLLIRN